MPHSQKINFDALPLNQIFSDPELTMLASRQALIDHIRGRYKFPESERRIEELKANWREGERPRPRCKETKEKSLEIINSFKEEDKNV
jgi:hypothetical protein